MSFLFDDFQRTDPSPASSSEDSFTFLNRVDTPFWGAVRRVLEQWFARYPADEAPELRERFRSKLPGHHWAAWWELYLHELFTRLGYGLTIHPELPDSKKTPDFELTRGDSHLYCEATVVFSGIVSGDDETGAPPWLLDAVNGVDNGNFFVRLVEVESAGAERLKNREVAEPLQEWLDGLDPDEATRGYEQGLGFPRRPINCRGWKVVFEAWPLKPEARGKPDHRVLGGGPMQSGFVNDVEQLRDKLKDKAGRYGRPQVPLVNAVLCMSSFMEQLDIEQALFGREAIQVPVNAGAEAHLIRQRNGFWTRRNGPQNQRVSAVLTAVVLHPWNAPKVTPHLWINPWANHPLGEEWPFPQTTATDHGQVVYREADPDMYAMFDLPAGWPGDKPFPRSTD